MKFLDKLLQSISLFHPSLQVCLARVFSLCRACQNNWDIMLSFLKYKIVCGNHCVWGMEVFPSKCPKRIQARKLGRETQWAIQREIEISHSKMPNNSTPLDFLFNSMVMGASIWGLSVCCHSILP